MLAGWPPAKSLVRTKTRLRMITYDGMVALGSVGIHFLSGSGSPWECGVTFLCLGSGLPMPLTTCLPLTPPLASLEAPACFTSRAVPAV